MQKPCIFLCAALGGSEKNWLDIAGGSKKSQASLLHQVLEMTSFCLHTCLLLNRALVNGQFKIFSFLLNDTLTHITAAFTNTAVTCE